MDDRPGMRDTYDRIAEHFAATREHPWPEIGEFLEGRSGDVALDVGCGNGRHAELLAAHAPRVVGVDLSPGLLDVATERAADRGFALDLLQADAGHLPVRDSVADLAVYVATLHHLPSRADRVGSLDELSRVLARGGRALVSAWSTAHDRFDRESGFDTTIDWTLPDGETVGRFYHVYDPEEFAADLADSTLHVERSFLASGNCYAVVAGEGKRT